MLSDSKQRYGKVTVAFHWVMAVLIGWQLLKLGDRIDDGEHWVGQVLVSWHISIGTLLLVLIIARLIWLARQKARPAHDPSTATLVKLGHGLLYVGMAVMPVTGLCAMVGAGYPVEAFGIALIGPGEGGGVAAMLGSLHSPIAWALTALIIGHIGMAFFHHFIRRDDSLRRIL